MEKFKLKGKVSLVTGGSRGIGLGIARALAEAGSDLALIARNQDGLETARKKLADTGRNIRVYPFDMADIREVDKIYERIASDAGDIDILVNNAGINRRGQAEKLAMEDWHAVIEVNLSSVYAMCRAFGRERIESKKGGKIINIASVMSETVREDNAPYAASKGGIKQLTKSLAVDWARHRINVNAIAPGFIRTDLTAALWENEEFNRWLRWKTPQARWGEPSDIGHTAVFLASDASDFITGQIIFVDGGLTATFGPTSW